MKANLVGWSKNRDSCCYVGCIWGGVEGGVKKGSLWLGRKNQIISAEIIILALIQTTFSFYYLMAFVIEHINIAVNLNFKQL